ncbi:hypothetical protein HYU89_01900 [Candidatus Collierbacteria bacterium]|nr:hypothetical protein [Candidatus Collierbacteria bacterium]
MTEYFNSPAEATDVRNELKKAKKQGAVSGGVFGSILKPGGRKPNSDIDIVINDHKAPYFGEIEQKKGKKSGTWLHIFRKKPGMTEGKSRYEEILDEAEIEGRKLFGGKKP